jgi:hypothetical protein
MIPDHLERSPGWVARELFSPSQIATAELCPRKWGYRYLRGWREPEHDWADIEAGKVKPQGGQRSRAFGKAFHVTGQAYYVGLALDPTSEVHRRFTSAVPFIPALGTPLLYTEHGVSIPATEADPIVWNERCSKDILLGTLGGAVWAVYDYKTCRDFEFTAQDGTTIKIKTPAQLIADTQANLYAWDVMTNTGQTWVPMRWIYARTDPKTTPQSRPVDFAIEHDGAAVIVARLEAGAKALRRVMRAGADVEALPPNPSACGAFGGCPYHVSRGGDCAAAWTSQTSITFGG